jgi:hypothetical protein
MHSVRYLRVLFKLGLAVLALGILAGDGNAVTAYQGKFTLPFEVYWAGSTLPAGDYTFEMESQGSPYTLYIRGQKANVVVRAISADEGVLSRTAQLNLVDISDVHTIRTFEAPELGVTFIYFTPTQKHVTSKEVHHQSLPQTEPARQVNASTMSISVHPSGR